MAVKVAINGTGRIGLCVARIIGAHNSIKLVALNSTADIDTLLHLLRYDSIHGHYDVEKLDETTLRIGNDEVKILSDRDPNNLDFSAYGATGVIECTGKFNSSQKSCAHLKGNITKVIISAPAQDTPTFVYGVNHTAYVGQKVISNASCTTNCLAPVAKILHEEFGIENALMTTIHSYTNDQNILDSKHKDIRRARAAALNLVPTTTGAAKSIGLVIPELEGKFNGLSIRVPTPDVSLIDLSVNLTKTASIQSINEAFLQAQDTSMRGLILVDEDQRVSSDFIGSSYSSILIPDKTMVIGNKSAKILAWYDNEMGYSYRLVDMSIWVLNH